MERRLKRAYEELKRHFQDEWLPFWEHNGVDETYGGYLVTYDENGQGVKSEDKFIVTQTRMIWAYSALARNLGKTEYLEAARQGVDFLVRHFWDETYGGWYWKTDCQGKVLDCGKVVYGQTFAIYALCEYTLASKDSIGLTYAQKTFDLLQKYCADTARGGYYENLEQDWSLSPGGTAAGDLKSLDIHMHTMEAFTTLYECSGKEIHRRKLEEVIELILKKMVNTELGCGYNQFTLEFERRPAIQIRRTWNAEREEGEALENPADTTSYGHNVELAWLLNRAGQILGKPADTYREVTQALLDHALKYGFDEELGGVYRDGPHEGAALVTDKEWWQNCEMLVGFLNGYELLGDQRYAEAFLKTWDFDNKYMINHEVGEWRQLLKKDGSVVVGSIGNPWKAMYHTGRTLMECKKRLERLLEES